MHVGDMINIGRHKHQIEILFCLELLNKQY